jgi:hypothetical protein
LFCFRFLDANPRERERERPRGRERERGSPSGDELQDSGHPGVREGKCVLVAILLDYVEGDLENLALEALGAEPGAFGGRDAPAARDFGVLDEVGRRPRGPPGLAIGLEDPFGARAAERVVGGQLDVTRFLFAIEAHGLGRTEDHVHVRPAGPVEVERRARLDPDHERRAQRLAVRVENQDTLLLIAGHRAVSYRNLVVR